MCVKAICWESRTTKKSLQQGISSKMEVVKLRVYLAYTCLCFLIVSKNLYLPHQIWTECHSLLQCLLSNVYKLATIKLYNIQLSPFKSSDKSGWLLCCLVETGRKCGNSLKNRDIRWEFCGGQCWEYRELGKMGKVLGFKESYTLYVESWVVPQTQMSKQRAVP